MESHITNEHGGLSVAISSVAKELKSKLNVMWQQLKSKSNDMAPSSDCIPLLKYNSKFIPREAESCLLICSMFPDDFRIPIEDLVTYGMGLNLFEDVDDMFAARCRVHDLIPIINGLKYSPKVIGDKIRLAYEKDGPCNQYVKMLVGARDLAKSIASNYPLVFHSKIVLQKWPESNSYKDCYGLSLELKKINEHFVRLECPKLALLQLQYRDDSQSIPVDFFDEMKELRVLSLDISSLPHSLDLLRNLRTLRLKVQKLEDMSWIGGMTNLEFLSIATLSLIGIPREMGQLENLKLLDLREVNIAYISPGVLSKMLKLEELYFPLSFKRWECKAKELDSYDEWESGEEDNFEDEERINTNISEIDDGERINASLSEIVSPVLNALQMSIPKVSILSKKSPIFKNIQVFKILMLNSIKYQLFGKELLNELQLTGDACDIKGSGICDLMSRTEKLSLIKVLNLKNVMYQLGDYDFPLLKKILISECDELEYVIDTTTKWNLPEDDYSYWKLVNSLHLSMLSNLKEIWHGQCAIFRWFENLSQISIRFCHKLKYGFPLSIVRRWTLLKSIEILDCNEMVGVFCEDEEDGIPLMLGSIEKLDLHSLPKLIGFLANKDNTINEVHDDTGQSLTTSKIVSNGSISTFDGNLEFFPTIESKPRLKECYIDDEELICPISTSKSRRKLQKGDTPLIVSRKQVTSIRNKEVIYCTFPSKLVEKWLQNLKTLKIAFCEAIEVVFLFEDNSASTRAYNSLKELELYGLQNLVHVWFQIPKRMIAFQNLQLLVLTKCHNICLFSSHVAKRLVKLQKLCISHCNKMEEIVQDEEEVEDKIVFHQLKLLELQHMLNLRMFSSGNHEIELPLLDSLKLNQCNKMKCFSYGLLRTPMLKRVEVNGSLYSMTEDLNVAIKREANRNGQLFTFVDLKIAANNFEGYYSGEIYKGWLDKRTFAPCKPGTGMAVAIRNLNSENEDGLEEWQSERHFLERLWHPNLVKLLGHCSEDGVFLVVYEFMQRGSLEDYLFGGNSIRETLSWDIRLKIAIGAARGLDILHTSEIKVIRRDIKASNILLDDNYNAKISGFGVAILGPSDEESYVTTQVIGTYGYVDPHYVATGNTK